MPRRFPLQPLVDFTQDQTDEAAKRLALLKGIWQNAEDKLQQLIIYREEYQGRLARASEGGISVTALMDYRAFLAKLDSAIEQQKQEVVRCQEDWERGKDAWLVQRRKLKAYQTLEQRHKAREDKREAKQEQREQDESARHSFHRNKEKKNSQ